MIRHRNLRRLSWSAAAIALALAAAPALAQTPLDDPLDARDAKRLDRMEKVLRELRAIVFKAQDSHAPVVVQPADTDTRMQELATFFAKWNALNPPLDPSHRAKEGPE